MAPGKTGLPGPQPVKIDAVRATAHSGDATYQGLLDHGSDLLLVCALEGLDEV